MPNDNALINWGHLVRFASNLKDKFDEVADARIMDDGETSQSLGDAIRTQVSGLKGNIDGKVANLKNDIYSHYSENFRCFPSKWEQGRYATDSASNVVSKITNDTASQLDIRIRTDIFYLDHSIRVDVASGYKVEIYRLNKDTHEKVAYVSWTTSYILREGFSYAVIAQKLSNLSISSENANEIITFTTLPRANLNTYSIKNISKNINSTSDDVLVTGIKYTYGGYSTSSSSYDSTFSYNDSEAGTKIRVRSDGPINIDGFLRVEADPGYTCVIYFADSNMKYKGSVRSDDGSSAYCKYDAYVLILKSGNAEITLDEAYEHVRIYTKRFKTFTFEPGGASTNSSGYYSANNSSSAMSIRLRTTPMLIDRPFRIKAKTGYQFDLLVYEKDSTGYKKLWAEQTWSHTTWLTESVHPGYKDKYIGITVRPADNTTTIYPININDYLEFEYNYGEKCIGDSPKRYENYKVLYIGDSITEVNYSATCNWTRLLNSWFNFGTVNNIGHGGTGIMAGTSTTNWISLVDNLDEEEEDYDLILIMGNMNDYSNNIFTSSSLGSFGDSTTSTEYGALKVFIDKVINKFPLAKIGWITSTPRQYDSGDDDNPNAVTTEGYLYGKNGVFEGAVKAIKDTCENYSIPVLDLYHESGFQPWNDTQKSKWMYNDGNYVHPNDAGHLIMATKIADFVKHNF